MLSYYDANPAREFRISKMKVPHFYQQSTNLNLEFTKSQLTALPTLNLDTLYSNSPTMKAPLSEEVMWVRHSNDEGYWWPGVYLDAREENSLLVTVSCKHQFFKIKPRPRPVTQALMRTH